MNEHYCYILSLLRIIHICTSRVLGNDVASFQEFTCHAATPANMPSFQYFPRLIKMVVEPRVELTTLP